MTLTDPGLAFWLDWARHEGALTEDLGAGVVAVVLPERVQHTLALPDELDVTSDPDAARHDGALLLVPGQPVLDRAADLVLTDGDAGTTWVPWPESPAPPVTSLIEAARQQFRVDHGRIDPAGEPAAGYLPVLRVGVLVTYTLSLDLRFQEREEVWVDAHTGLELDERVRSRVASGVHGSRPFGARPELSADLRAACAEADELISSRARRRLSTLSRQADDARRRELEGAEAYYTATLDSVHRRRAAAPPERQAVLDAQAEAIRVEAARRRAEIEATFSARHEVRPFRAHLLLVPALQVAVDVMRGSRAYPSTLVWLPAASTFLPVRCPHCGGADILVAGRRHLGCRSCLPPAPLVSAPPAAEAPPTRPSPPTAATGTPIPSGDAGHARAVPPATATATARPMGGRVPRPSKRVTPPEGARAKPTGSPDVVGRRLADELWFVARIGERWPRKGKGVTPGSPFAAATRLFGVAAAARAVGLAVPRSIVDVTVRTLPGLGPLHVTTGAVWIPSGPIPYSLRWAFDGSKPALSEIVPVFAAARPETIPFDCLPPLLTCDAPLPRGPLDPVADAIWELAVAPLGLPLVLRCLAAWWRVAGELADSRHPPEALAAAVVRLVAVQAHAAARASEAVVGVDVAAVAAATRALKTPLRLSRHHPW